jgi:hypothetical protein
MCDVRAPKRNNLNIIRRGFNVKEAKQYGPSIEQIGLRIML